MGVIQRQSSKQSIVKLISVAVGFVSMLFVYPLNHEIYGFAQFIYSFAALLVPFLGLGISQSIIKFHPDNIKTNKGGSFLANMFFVQTIVIIVFSLFLYLIKEPVYGLMENMDMNVTLLRSYEKPILILSAFLIFCGLITNYISNYGLIVIPSAFTDLGYKVFLPILILLVHFGIFYKGSIPTLIILFYLLVLICLLIYGYRKKTFTTLTPNSLFANIDVREFFKYSIYGALGSIGAILAFRIDAIMITSLLNEESTGLYFNIFVIAMIIDIPNQAIGKVAGPIINKNWKTNNVIEIQDIYTKAALNAFIASLLLFLGILFNLDDLLSLSSNPEVFKNATLIFTILGAAKLIDSITGINSHIIVYSSAYKYNLFFLGFLGVLNIIFNFMFIPKYGIIGAAIATFTSLTLYNMAKFIFIYIKFKMIPFDTRFIYIILIGIGVIVFIYLIPMPNNVFLSIILRSILITGLYVSGVYFSKSSEDLNEMINKFLIRIRN